MGSIQTIVIAFNGNEPNPTLVGQLKALVEASGAATGNACKISVISEEELYRSAATVVVNQPGFIPAIDQHQQAIEAAVVYIGEKFSEQLTGNNKSIPAFTVALSAATTSARINRSDNRLINAVDILNTHSGKIPAALSKKYGFNQSVLTAIKSVYSSPFTF